MHTPGRSSMQWLPRLALLLAAPALLALGACDDSDIQQVAKKHGYACKASGADQFPGNAGVGSDSITLAGATYIEGTLGAINFDNGSGAGTQVFCDPLLVAMGSGGTTQISAFIGLTPTAGDVIVDKGVELSVAAAAPGTYDLASGTLGWARIDINGTVCQANPTGSGGDGAATVTITNYPAIGGVLTGSYSVTAFDSGQTGCPTVPVSGTFGITLIAIP